MTLKPQVIQLEKPDEEIPIVIGEDEIVKTPTETKEEIPVIVGEVEKEIIEPSIETKRKITDIFIIERTLFSPSNTYKPKTVVVRRGIVAPKLRINRAYGFLPFSKYSYTDLYQPSVASKSLYKPKLFQKLKEIFAPQTTQEYTLNKDYDLEPLIVNTYDPSQFTDVYKYAPESNVKIAPETHFEINLKPQLPSLFNVTYYNLLRRMINED